MLMLRFMILKKCFDKMWASETANDMFKAGLNDDTFVLVANSNSECQVAVKTPWGKQTKRKTLKNIEMQGGVLTPLKCSVQIDTLGKVRMLMMYSLSQSAALALSR